MLAKVSIVCATVGVLLLSGTTGSCTTKCFTVLIHGLHIQVVDSITNGTVTASEVTVIAIDGTFRDSVTTSNVNSPLRLAEERGGTYRLEVRAVESSLGLEKTSESLRTTAMYTLWKS